MEKTSTNVKTVEIIADKIYFLEESVNIFVKSDKESLKSSITDWIGLYKCGSNRHLKDYVAVGINLISFPTKDDLIPFIFYAKQLKNVYCNTEYEFLYGNKFNKICGISHPVKFFHKNKCFCSSKIQKSLTSNQFKYTGVSQDVIDSLLARMTLVKNQLNKDKMQINEIVSMNTNLWNLMNNCELLIQQNHKLLNDYPVTNDG